MAGNGIQPEQEQEQEQESHVLPSSGSASSNLEPNPPSTPLSKIPPALITRDDDKTPATSCNLLSWFRHPLATFRASLKRRRCASSSGDNNDPKAERKVKKAQILGGGACAAEDDEALQEKKKGTTTTVHIVDDCLNDNDDDDVYVKKEGMDIAKKEKAKPKEEQGSPENVVEKKWVGQPIDITRCNNHKETTPITMEEAAAAHTGLKMDQQLAAGIQDAAENAEEAAPATEDTAVTAVSGIQEIK